MWPSLKVTQKIPDLTRIFKATEDKAQNQENKNQENQAVENQNNQSATSFLTYFMILLFAMLAGMSWILNFLYFTSTFMVSEKTILFWKCLKFKKSQNPKKDSKWRELNIFNSKTIKISRKISSTLKFTTLREKNESTRVS